MARLLHDLAPVALFFALYQFLGIYWATAGLMVAMAVDVTLRLAWHKSVSPMQWGALALVWVFGAATLVLQNPRFIQWKPTLLEWGLAGVFLGSHWIGQRVLVARMLDRQVALTTAQWRGLNLAWAGFLLALGGLNLLVAYGFDEATWVHFKLFGLTGLTLLFLVVQGLWLARHGQPLPPASPSSQDPT
ncbi:MAG: septation protein A [Magnetococcus sp. WYHC-3]